MRRTSCRCGAAISCAGGSASRRRGSRASSVLRVAPRRVGRARRVAHDRDPLVHPDRARRLAVREAPRRVARRVRAHLHDHVHHPRGGDVARDDPGSRSSRPLAQAARAARRRHLSLHLQHRGDDLWRRAGSAVVRCQHRLRARGDARGIGDAAARARVPHLPRRAPLPARAAPRRRRARRVLVRLGRDAVDREWLRGLDRSRAQAAACCAASSSSA